MAVKPGRAAIVRKRVAQVVLQHVPVLRRSDLQRVDDGARPEGRLGSPASTPSRVLQLIGEQELHLLAVFLTKRRRVAAQQGTVDGDGAHYVPLTSPVALACWSRALSRSTSAAATRLPKRVSR